MTASTLQAAPPKVKPTLSHVLDPVNEAVQYWEGGQAELFSFAVSCAQIVGLRNGETLKLSNRLHISVDTVERYAKGGILWNDMLKYKPRESEVLREALYISFWNDIGRLYVSEELSLDGAWHWLDEAYKNKWTVEKLRSMLPTKGKTSNIKRSAAKIANLINAELINAPAFDVDPHVYKVTRKLAVVTVRWLDKLAGKEENK